VSERVLSTRELNRALLRSTIHIVSAADYPPFAEAIRSARRAWWTLALVHQE
jgi:hypothetical protein